MSRRSKLLTDGLTMLGFCSLLVSKCPMSFCIKWNQYPSAMSIYPKIHPYRPLSNWNGSGPKKGRPGFPYHVQCDLVCFSCGFKKRSNSSIARSARQMSCGDLETSKGLRFWEVRGGLWWSGDSPQNLDHFWDWDSTVGRNHSQYSTERVVKCQTATACVTFANETIQTARIPRKMNATSWGSGGTENKTWIRHSQLLKLCRAVGKPEHLT